MQCSQSSHSRSTLKLAGWAPPWTALPCRFALSILSLAVLDGMMELEASSFPAQIRLTAGAPVKSQGGSPGRQAAVIVAVTLGTQSGQSVSQISYRDDDVPLCVGLCGVSRGIGWCCSNEKASEVSCAIHGTESMHA